MITLAFSEEEAKIIMGEAQRMTLFSNKCRSIESRKSPLHRPMNEVYTKTIRFFR
jgi:hypothetical protein